jgi:PilZ domain
MTQLTRFFAEISLSDPSVWLALGSGFAVVLVFLLLGRRHRRPAAIAVIGENASEAKTVDDWPPNPNQPDERRRTSRRSGVPTAIQMVEAKKFGKVQEGFVLDRSSGGLRVATERPLPTGSVLQVRPTNAPPETPWVIVIIRSCKESGDFFEIGCQFQEVVPWHVLLMFG